mgnify:CR=1 FL=1
MQCTYTCSAHAVHTHTQCTCSAHAHAVHTQCTRSRCAPAAQYKAPALTSSQAVRCASAVLEVVRGFSLDGFAQGALSECTITLHAGMGVGQLSVLYVGGGNQRHKYGAEHAAQPSVLQVPQGSGLGLDLLATPYPYPYPDLTLTLTLTLLQAPQGPLGRDGVAVMGPPITQLQKAEEKAGPGECVMSPELWALVAAQGWPTLTPDPNPDPNRTRTRT